jgi:nitrogen regulatory protein P-II 1
MLKIEVLVRPERVSDVTKALDDSGCTGYYYDNVTGQGRQRGVEVITGRGGQVATRSAVPKTKITTVIADNLLDAVVTAIVGAARSPGEGEIGDGKIFVSPMSDVIRVRTEERGESAI